MEALLDGFRAANTQVLGVSVDSIHCHANWARDLGGVSFPLLADFHPKGAVAQSFGHYLADAGITDRATVVIDRDGVVRYSESVTPSGQRDIDQLLEICRGIHQDGPPAEPWPSTDLPADTTIFVKNSCGSSRRVRVALDNLHATGRVRLRNVSEDPAAAQDLVRIGGKDQAPCLVLGDQALYEGDAITAWLANRIAPCG